MSQEQRTLLAIALMFALVLLVQLVFPSKIPPGKQGASPSQTGTAAPAPPTPAGMKPSALQPDARPGGSDLPEREVRVETKTLSVVLTTQGGGVKS